MTLTRMKEKDAVSLPPAREYLPPRCHAAAVTGLLVLKENNVLNNSIPSWRWGAVEHLGRLFSTKCLCDSEESLITSNRWVINANEGKRLLSGEGE